jgi:hypothetical protein
MMNEFKTMAEITNKAFEQATSLMAYCDYIAELISKEMKAEDEKYMRLLSSVSRPQYDLGPQGQFQSTKKTINVEDRYGKKYTITVEEA